MNCASLSWRSSWHSIICTETGFYYLQARYYDPSTCRFINADGEDTLTATMDGVTDKNLYAYCDNNPVTRADEDGDIWELALAGGGYATGSALVELGGQVHGVQSVGLLRVQGLC